MKEHRQYLHFLKKVRERLTLIFDHHLPQGKDIIDSDRELLHVLYKVFYNGEIERLSKEPLSQKQAIQSEMFKQVEEVIPFGKPDKKAEKPDGMDIDNSKK